MPSLQNLAVFAVSLAFVSLSLPTQAKPYAPPFKNIDLNHDGKITQNEILTVRKQNFDKADKNRDGNLTTQEVLEMMPWAIRPLAKQKVADFLKTQDRNRDGKVVLNELLENIKVNFPKADKNKDGAISQTEYEQGIKFL